MKTEARVYLAPLKNEHIDRYMMLSDDPELIVTMGWRPFGPDEKERFVQFSRVLTIPNLDSDIAKVFSIISIVGDQPIGYVSIKGICETEARAEVGIAIMEKKYRGQGFGTEALKQAVDYAFSKLNLKCLGLTVFPSNHRAIRVYKKTGFRRTQVLKNSWLLPSGEHTDMWLMELSRKWLP